MAKYKITNPYQSVTALLGNDENHYKTNLHTHSTYSDANDTMLDMIRTFYDQDFDILAFAEHGLLGKEWDQDPTIVPLFLFQNLWHGKRIHPNTAQYKAITSGTYKTKADTRTKKRGLQCVPNAIEANMWTFVKNHVNGYFTDNACEGLYGTENDFETPIRKIENSGGVSHINHPTDWLQARKYPDCAKDPENVEFFADLLRRYHSCLGIEVLNMYDRPNFCDRELWDSLLMTLIPEGKRSVWGFANSDAHKTYEIDTAFMDFILPDYSLDRLRTAMENGTFFAQARYAKYELGENFEGKGELPEVKAIEVDEQNDTITVAGENCDCIEWIADGEVIQSDCGSQSTIHLGDYSDKISCYVRFQLKGQGGICMAQPFICDDGDMKRFAKPEPADKPMPNAKERRNFSNTRAGVIVERMILKK